METVFKVGMEVWDKTISPNKGRVIEVFTDAKFDFPIKVEFENDIRARYTNKGCFVKSEGVLPTLSTTDYSLELKGFEQKAPAPTYEEALVKAKTNFNGYPSYELAMAAEALQKLLFLRDYYNKDWRPDWSNTNVLKYVIIVSREKIEIDNTYNIKRILAFKSKEIRNKFLEEQKELLEIAKPLL